MTDHPLSRRRLMQLAASGAAATPFIHLSAGATINMSEGESPKAIGQPMPRGVELPATPPPPPGEKSLGIAVMGLGYYALAKIMPVIKDAPHCHLAAIISGNPKKAARVASAYGLSADAIYSYENFDEIAADDRVGAVYIVLPTGLHAEWTEKAFAAGKHVLCEKPMALNAAESMRMIAAAKTAGKKLMIAYRCHFEPFNLHAMELMREETLGALRLIRTAHQYRAGPTTPAANWRFNRALAGGGPLEDYGLYGLQAALYLSGEMPERVSAMNSRPANDARFTEIFAHTATQLQFPSGTVAQLSTSYDSAGANMVHVRGQKGVLAMEPATSYDGQTMTLRLGRTSTSLDPGNPAIQFAAMLDHFGKAVLDGATIRTPGEMGLRDMRLIDAIYRSAAEGRMLQLNPDGTVKES